jgi:hypothetical protein
MPFPLNIALNMEQINIKRKRVRKIANNAHGTYVYFMT